jgi:hypothetical protein
MKKIRYVSCLAILLSFTLLFFAQQEIQQEYVQVLNIEMLVRVMKDGRPLAGLKKEEFSLFENGRKQDINGFIEVHRSITPTGTKAEAKIEEKTKSPGRLFLLFFWINEPSVKVDEVLDYFFNSIYREGDRVILADQSQSLEINSVADKEAKLAEFKSGLLAFSRKLIVTKDRLKSNLESFLEEFKICVEAGNPSCDTILFGRYNQLLKEYRMENQAPNNSRLEAMSHSLEAIDTDKWALVFFQHDSLPLFDIEQLRLEGGRWHFSNVIINEIEKMNRDLFSPRGTLRLADSLRTRFIQANAQFYLMLLGSRQAPISNDVTSQYPVVNPFLVFSNWEDAFRQITEATGGEVMDGNRMKEALAEVANREDVYYVLTYAPDQGKSRQRRVDINVDRDGVKVIHGRRVEMENLPQIKLAAIEPGPGKVRLDLENFYMIGHGEERSGLVKVTLFAARENEKPQVLAKNMEIATTGSVEIPITGLEPGRYQLTAQVVDGLTGLQVQGESSLDVLGGEMPAETLALLKLAADYAERLRHAAFRFICRETVNEDLLARDVMDRSAYKRNRTSWLYEYQVVVRDGKVSEDRVLLRKNNTKKRVENAELETRFRSLYSAFLPATLFAADKQSSFYYSVEKHEKMYGRPVARLAVAPRPGYEELGAGTAWVDEETGAVLKIELAQRAIKGIEDAEKRAKKSGARLLVSDVHYYGIERDGIWLPSSTTISEYYVIEVVAVKENPGFTDWHESPETPATAKYASRGKKQQLELSRTWVEYSDFKFFVVGVQTKEEPLK